MMRNANRNNAKFAILIGDDELEKNVVTVKDLQEGGQTEVALDDVVSFAKEKLG